jgi:hypothetical protein
MIVQTLQSLYPGFPIPSAFKMNCVWRNPRLIEITINVLDELGLETINVTAALVCPIMATKGSSVYKPARCVIHIIN